MDKLAKTIYSRNLWTVMKKFNVLPSDPAFQNLTDSHIAYIISNMLIDNREEELIRKGIDPSTYVEDDSFEWEGELKLPEGDEAEQIVESALALKQKVLDKDVPGAELSEEERRQIEAIKEVKRRVEELYEQQAEMAEVGSDTEEDYIFRTAERDGHKPSDFNAEEDDFLNFRDEILDSPSTQERVTHQPEQDVSDSEELTDEELDELAMQEITKGFNQDF